MAVDLTVAVVLQAALFMIFGRFIAPRWKVGGKLGDGRWVRGRGWVLMGDVSVPRRPDEEAVGRSADCRVCNQASDPT